MIKKFIAGGCSFTLGNELSDDVDGKTLSKKTWSYGLFENSRKDANTEYKCTASGGSGNSGIARRVFNALSHNESIDGVVIMWSFLSRYDWAMPRHKLLEDTRWTSVSPWDTNSGNEEAFRTMQGSETQQEHWRARNDLFVETGVKPFAEAIYKYAANQYHEIYLSWKSIIWLQNLLEKKRIPYMFTLADNTLFYDKFTHHKDQDRFMNALHSEIDISKWFFFGERCMGFNQWALLNDYPRGTTHPLDKAHEDAVKLMLPTLDRLIGVKK
jgi:hypothetical protein